MNEEEIELLCLRASVTQYTSKTVLTLSYLQVIMIEKKKYSNFHHHLLINRGRICCLCVLNKDLWRRVTHNRLYSLMLN